MANFGSVAVVLVVAAATVQHVSSLPATGITQSAESLVGSGKTESLGESRIGDVLGKSQGWTLNAVDVKAKAISLIAEGQQPIGVKNWINTQLLPQAKQTAMEMQAQVDGAEQAIDACKDLLWSAEKEVKHRESILAEDTSERFQCVAKEHQAHKVQVDNCEDLQSLVKLVVDNQPANLASITNRTIDAVENVLRKNQQFAADFYTKMVDKQSACISATQASDTVHAECEDDAENIKIFYCTMRYGRDQSCNAYTACYTEKTAAFDKTLTDVHALETHTIEQFKKLTCFGREIPEDGVGTTNCSTDGVNAAHLAVRFPLKPSAKTCVSIMASRSSDFSTLECKDGHIVPHSAISTGPEHTGGSNSTSSAGDGTALVANGGLAQSASKHDSNSTSAGVSNSNTKAKKTKAKKSSSTHDSNSTSVGVANTSTEAKKSAPKAVSK